MNKLEERFEEVLYNCDDRCSLEPGVDVNKAKIDCAKEAKELAIYFFRYCQNGNWIYIYKNGKEDEWVQLNLNKPREVGSNVLSTEKLWNQFLEAYLDIKK